jgi:hypothetical protein
MLARALLALLFSAALAGADRILQVEFVPTDDLQIAVWLEDAAGHYVDTLLVTRLTATFGLGNRPGRWDMKSGYLWPYGRRTGVLPVWAHRRNQQYPLLVFQDCHENSLGFHETYSSLDPFYCRPMRPDEMDVDVVTCPTPIFSSDKGIPRALIAPINPDCSSVIAGLPETTLYPPRNDIAVANVMRDWDDVLTLAQLNDLDAVSRATPPAGQVVRLRKEIGDALDGSYVVWVEASKEYDFNDAYTETDQPGFTDPSLPAYGLPYAGQPSVVWKVPIEIGAQAATEQAIDYAGYGAVDGADGGLRPADDTISDSPGSGAGRLQIVDGTWRVRAHLETDAVCLPPDAPIDLRLEDVGFDDAREIYAEFAFVAPQDDTGDPVYAYQVRYRMHDPIQDERQFMEAVPALAPDPEQPGTRQLFSITHLEPMTQYHVAIRAVDECLMNSSLATASAVTTGRPFTKTPPCFVATAAWGTPLAAEVDALRRLRDRRLMQSDLGRLFVALYQATSPPLAAALRQSEPLRASVRRVLSPVARAALALP